MERPKASLNGPIPATVQRHGGVATRCRLVRSCLRIPVWTSSRHFRQMTTGRREVYAVGRRTDGEPCPRPRRCSPTKCWRKLGRPTLARRGFWELTSRPHRIHSHPVGHQFLFAPTPASCRCRSRQLTKVVIGSRLLAAGIVALYFDRAQKRPRVFQVRNG